ncbi:hypothetical protein [Planktothrix agardhii]|nr:hypothetical protein [Planktothrix agardhii]MCF3575752.1 hypothetical protein [Planktothrix agardhii 1812]
MEQTGDSQEATKTQDEIKRTEINTNIQSIFDKTQGTVKGILGKMDSDVNTEFNRGISAAKNAFEGHVKRRMAEYKDKRYTLVFPIKLPKPYWFGIKMVKVGELRIFDFITWIRDKFAGLPDEVNVFYEEKLIKGEKKLMLMYKPYQKTCKKLGLKRRRMCKLNLINLSRVLPINKINY